MCWDVEIGITGIDIFRKARAAAQCKKEKLRFRGGHIGQPSLLRLGRK